MNTWGRIYIFGLCLPAFLQAEYSPIARQAPIAINSGFSFSEPLVQNHQLDFGFPIYRSGPTLVIASTRFGYRHIAHSPELSNIGSVADTYLNSEFGVGVFHDLDQDRRLGARLSIGSASDHLFTGANSATLLATSFYSFPSSATSRWSVSLFYTNNSPVLPAFPIPGFSYTYQPNPQLLISTGIPFFSLRWIFAQPLRLEIQALGPTNLRMELACGDPGALHYGGFFAWSQQLYLRRDRFDERDRLFFDDKRIGLSVRNPLGGGFEAVGETGYVFDRSVFESRSYFRSARGNAQLPASGFVSFSLRWNPPQPATPSAK